MRRVSSLNEQNHRCDRELNHFLSFFCEQEHPSNIDRKETLSCGQQQNEEAETEAVKT